MNLFKFNLRKYIYLSLGWFFYASILMLIMFVSFSGIEKPTISSYTGAFFISLLIFLFVFLVCMVLEHWFGKKLHTFLYVPIFHFKILKPIYHIDLGYFIIGVNTEPEKYGRGVRFSLDAYVQSFLYRVKIIDDTCINEVAEKEISRKIKEKLDYIFSEKIRTEREKEANRKRQEHNEKLIEEAKSKLKEWDGFLDRESRRDGRIDKIIK